jgi:hypothetical protein
MFIFHCLLPGFHPIGWLRAFLLSLVSVLSHFLRLLGVLRKGKFFILDSAYPQRLSGLEGNTGLGRQGCDDVPINFPCFQKSDISVSHNLVEFLQFFNYWA